MEHPDWYYKYFDCVFARGRAYNNEINLIDNIAHLKDKRVQEIGAGTGEHSFRLLMKQISFLELIDYDIKSIEILTGKFGVNENVNILYNDGFVNLSTKDFDIIVCMYSIILLSINKLEELSRRLDILIERLNNNGYLFFEIVDYDVCKMIYKENKESNLFKKGLSELNVKSRYLENKLDNIYTGKLDSEKVFYKASLLRLNKTDILHLLRSKKVSDVGCVSLDNFDRRLLVFIRT